jgi:uncharacterized protein
MLIDNNGHKLRKTGGKMVGPTYETEKTCVICSKSFPVIKVRSRLTLTYQDSDFCTHYKEVNPNYYSIWVCPHCGYAGYDAYFEELPQAGRDKIAKFLASREVNVDFGGTRTCADAIATFKLALFFASRVKYPDSRIATMCLRLGWLYREAEQQDDEVVALDKARQYYEQALLKERTPIGSMSLITIEYLIGELYRLTGKFDEALSYLGKVVGDRQAKLEPRILDLAREAWYKTREQKKQLKESAVEGKAAAKSK